MSTKQKGEYLHGGHRLIGEAEINAACVCFTYIQNILYSMIISFNENIYTVYLNIKCI